MKQVRCYLEKENTNTVGEEKRRDRQGTVHKREQE